MAEQNNPGNIGAIIVALSEITNIPPFMIRERLEDKFPALKDKSTCGNCGASMQEYEDRFDALDAALLIHMGMAVKAAWNGETTFTEANDVRVQNLLLSLSQKCRTTQAAKLGLIAKVTSPSGRHVPGHWLITSRGWAALRNEPVPARVVTFRNRIVERHTEEMITLSEVLDTRKSKVEQALKEHKDVGAQDLAVIADRDNWLQNPWFHVAGLAEGKLL